MSHLTLDVQTAAGSTAGQVELPAEIFDREVSISLLHQVVNAQLAARRQGTHSTKTRGEVRGGGKKPFRQKGTGRARQGSIRAPHFTGGGISHGALSDRARHARIHVVDELVAGQKPSTKSALAFLSRLTDRKKILFVVGRDDVTSRLSARNLPGVTIRYQDQLNTYDVLYSDDVVFSVEALNAFIARTTAAAEKA